MGGDGSVHFDSPLFFLLLRILNVECLNIIIDYCLTMIIRLNGGRGRFLID